jgi:predicted lipoprotein with Yx(FWY)xxD motif
MLAGMLALGMLTVAGCGDSGGGNSAAGTSSPSSSAAVAKAVLATAHSDLGTIVVDGARMTVYVFDKDTPNSGKSACSGDCLAKWPAVTSDSDSPTVDGVTGTVGTITRDDGTKQVTLDGLPLYLWANDNAPGDVTGQGVGGVWWVVGADGAKITTAPAAAGAPSY